MMGPRNTYRPKLQVEPLWMTGPSRTRHRKVLNTLFFHSIFHLDDGFGHFRQRFITHRLISPTLDDSHLDDDFTTIV